MGPEAVPMSRVWCEPQGQAACRGQQWSREGASPPAGMRSAPLAWCRGVGGLTPVPGCLGSCSNWVEGRDPRDRPRPQHTPQGSDRLEYAGTMGHPGVGGRFPHLDPRVGREGRVGSQPSQANCCALTPAFPGGLCIDLLPKSPCPLQPHVHLGWISCQLLPPK